MKRRYFLNLVAASVLVVSACAGLAPSESPYPPIVFVHGQGGTAARWTTTIWRFESNGWPRDRLYALDTAYPFARDDDAKQQEGASSTTEHTAQLAAEVERVRRLAGAEKVVLIGHSRGGYAIRDYIRNGPGKAVVSHAILGGTPNHGAWNTAEYLPGNEYNGTGPFLTALNNPQGPDGMEVTPGVAFMTLRSDHQDMFAQPDGRWIGQPSLRTNVSYEGPALRGAENVVLPGADHGQLGYAPEAFANMFRFITGRLPARSGIVPEQQIVLDGKVSGSLGAFPTNLPVAGATVEVFEVAPQTGERLMSAHKKVTAADGMWGPFAAKPDACYEFVIQADGYAITHIYRSPFPRSSAIVHLRPARLANQDKGATSVVQMIRPGGGLGVGRDRMSLDGRGPPGVAPGIPSAFLSTLRLNEQAMRSLVAELNDERIVVQTWPTRENHLVRAEFHY